MREGRVLGIDPGSKRIGLAISDPLGNFAIGLDTIAAANNPVEIIASLCSEKDIRQIVVGHPLHMSGDVGDKATQAQDFAKLLQEKTQLPVELLDERLTSVLAHQTLQAQGISPSKNKEKVDQAAAVHLLQNYLDKLNR